MAWTPLAVFLRSESDVRTDFALGVSSPLPEITEALTGLQQYRKVKDVLWPSGCFFGPDDIVEIGNGNELTVRLKQVRVAK